MKELEAIATAPHVRSEKAEEQLCDDFVARQVGREGVVRISQPRNTMQTLGISDRRYRVASLAFWWEVKRADGVLRTEQVEFLEAELRHGSPAGVGTLEDLVAYVSELRGVPVDQRRVRGCLSGMELVEKYRVRRKKAKRGKL